MPQDPVPDLLSRATERLEEQFARLPAFEPAADPAAMARVLEEAARRLGDNYPYFHPLYAGQMLKPPHPVARAAYALAMTINPNNHARDGGRASSEMEIEAVRRDRRHLRLDGISGPSDLERHDRQPGGALGGRPARAGQAHCRLRAGALHAPAHLRRAQARRMRAIAADSRGRMNLEALEAELRKGDVGTVVATLGTTAMGAVDPLDEILALREKYGFRVHVDAAYGGYFRLIPEALDDAGARPLLPSTQADSIVIDPHKHGLQPYGCGCVLFRDPAVGRFYKHDSPYTYFTSKELHLGEISLECSRAGAAAVALWATQRLLPLVPGGEFARGLASSRAAALELDRRLRRTSRRFEPLAAGPPELDIVVWKMQCRDSQSWPPNWRKRFFPPAPHGICTWRWRNCRLSWFAGCKLRGR